MTKLSTTRWLVARMFLAGLVSQGAASCGSSNTSASGTGGNNPTIGGYSATGGALSSRTSSASGSSSGGRSSSGGSIVSATGGTSMAGTTITNPTGTVGRSVGQPGPYNWNNVAIVGGGYVPAIIFSPVEKDLIYARTDMGGAYRWDKSSSQWLPLTDWVGFDDWNYLGIESIAPDPKDANRLYVAAGTYTNGWVW